MCAKLHQMRWVLATIASAVMILGGPQLAWSQWGSLKGQFVLDGQAPEAAAINADKDVPTCGKCSLKDEKLVVNGGNGGIRNIVVLLSPEKGKEKSVKVHPSYGESAGGIVTIANQCCRFEPRIVTLRTSQTLQITNPDPVAHNSNVASVKNASINPSIPAGGKVDAKFPKEENLPCTISCNIHPWMKGYIVVKDHPYMAVTDADGKFEIKDLPAGKWQFRVWQESSGYVAKVKLGGKETNKRGEFEATIEDGKSNDVGIVKVDPKVFSK